MRTPRPLLRRGPFPCAGPARRAPPAAAVAGRVRRSAPSGLFGPRPPRALRAAPRSRARPVCAAVRLRGRSLAPLPRPRALSGPRCAPGRWSARGPSGFAGSPRGSACLPSVGSSLAPLRAPRASGPAAPGPCPRSAFGLPFAPRGRGLGCARGLPRLLRFAVGSVVVGCVLPCAPPPRRPRWGLRGA